MKKIIFVITLYLGTSNVHGQIFESDKLISFVYKNVNELSKILTHDGWYYVSEKNNTRFRTYTWCFDCKQSPIFENQLVAKYWLKKVYSNTTHYQAIDYTTDEKTYLAFCELVNIKKIRLLSTENRENKYIRSYGLNNLSIDLVEYQDSENKFGIILGLNK